MTLSDELRRLLSMEPDDPLVSIVESAREMCRGALGLAAGDRARLEHGDFVVAREQVGGGESGDPAPDDADVHPGVALERPEFRKTDVIRPDRAALGVPLVHQNLQKEFRTSWSCKAWATARRAGPAARRPRPMASDDASIRGADCRISASSSRTGRVVAGANDEGSNENGSRVPLRRLALRALELAPAACPLRSFLS